MMIRQLSVGLLKTLSTYNKPMFSHSVKIDWRQLVNKLTQIWKQKSACHVEDLTETMFVFLLY